MRFIRVANWRFNPEHIAATVRYVIPSPGMPLGRVRVRVYLTGGRDDTELDGEDNVNEFFRQLDQFDESTPKPEAARIGNAVRRLEK